MLVKPNSCYRLVGGIGNAGLFNIGVHLNLRRGALVTVQTNSLAAGVGEDRAGREGDGGQIRGHLVMAGDAGNHGAYRVVLIHLEHGAAVYTQEVMETDGAVALGTVLGDLGRVICVPVGESLSFDIRVTGFAPGLQEGNVHIGGGIPWRRGWFNHDLGRRRWDLFGRGLGWRWGLGGRQRGGLLTGNQQRAKHQQEPEHQNTFRPIGHMCILL
jgi:hypothetical protein